MITALLLLPNYFLRYVILLTTHQLFFLFPLPSDLLLELRSPRVPPKPRRNWAWASEKRLCNNTKHRKEFDTTRNIQIPPQVLHPRKLRRRNNSTSLNTQLRRSIAGIILFLTYTPPPRCFSRNIRSGWALECRITRRRLFANSMAVNRQEREGGCFVITRSYIYQL